MSTQALHWHEVACEMSRSRRRNAKYVFSTVSSSCEPSSRSAEPVGERGVALELREAEPRPQRADDRGHEVREDVLGVIELGAGEVARVPRDVGDQQAGRLRLGEHPPSPSAAGGTTIVARIIVLPRTPRQLLQVPEPGCRRRRSGWRGGSQRGEGGGGEEGGEGGRGRRGGG